jgi:hypothetical protein
MARLLKGNLFMGTDILSLAVVFGILRTIAQDAAGAWLCGNRC